MISGGNATIFVSDLEVAVAFYTETLGLPLLERYENEWAAVIAGKNLIIGLHPNADFAPRAGTPGSITVGLDVKGSLEEAVDALEARGVRVQPIVEDPTSPARLAFFEDPDGNVLYLLELNIR